MLISKTEKGFSMIEAVISTAMFMIILSCIVNMYAKVINIKNENKLIYQYTAFMEALKNNMEYNMTYDDLQNLYTDSKLYIYSGDINIDSLKNKDIKSIFKSTSDRNYPYAVMSMEKINENSEYEAYAVTAELKYHLKNEEKSIRYVLFKPKKNIT